MQEEANPSICNIVDVASPSELIVCWWWRHNELSSFDGLEALLPISAALHRTLQLDDHGNNVSITMNGAIELLNEYIYIKD